MSRPILISVFLVLLLGQLVIAQDVPIQAAPPEIVDPVLTAGDNEEGTVVSLTAEQWWRSTAVPYLGVGLLVFTVLMFTGLYITIWYEKDWSDQTFKVFGLTLIITAGLYLITIGWTDKQLAPMMGLLGTIAGYILGQDRRREDRNINKGSATSTPGETGNDES